MVGGIVTSFILELLVYPTIYAVWREGSLKHKLSPDHIVVGRHVNSGLFGQNDFALLRPRQS